MLLERISDIWLALNGGLGRCEYIARWVLAISPRPEYANRLLEPPPSQVHGDEEAVHHHQALHTGDVRRVAASPSRLHAASQLQVPAPRCAGALARNCLGVLLAIPGAGKAIVHSLV